MSENPQVVEDVTPVEIDPERLERLRSLLLTKEQFMWEIGDLILEIAGPAGSKNSKLRQLAAQLKMTERQAASWRAVAERFPTDNRAYEAVPWAAYNRVKKQGELAEVILERYAQRLDREAVVGRPASDSLLRDIIEEVRAEHNIPPRTARKTQTDLCLRHLRKWEAWWLKGDQSQKISVAEAELLHQETSEVAARLHEFLRNSR